jgi:hypothetical protein
VNILNNRVKFYQDVQCDLRHLQNSFEEYFPQNNNDKNFTGSYQMQDFSLNEYGQLIDFLRDSVFKQIFLFFFEVFRPA